MSRKKLALLVWMVLVLILASGCGSLKKSRVAGTYEYGPDPQFQLELKRDGTYQFVSTAEWPLEWPMTIAFTFPHEGTWFVGRDNIVRFRSQGTETPFGEVRGNEIVDLFGSVWKKK